MLRNDWNSGNDFWFVEYFDCFIKVDGKLGFFYGFLKDNIVCIERSRCFCVFKGN